MIVMFDVDLWQWMETASSGQWPLRMREHHHASINLFGNFCSFTDFDFHSDFVISVDNLMSKIWADDWVTGFDSHTDFDLVLDARLARIDL